MEDCRHQVRSLSRSRRGCLDCVVSASATQKALRLLNHSPSLRFSPKCCAVANQEKNTDSIFEQGIRLKMWQFVHDLNLSLALTFLLMNKLLLKIKARMAAN